MECGMERRFHRGFTASEKTELWDRWKRGESLKAIGRASSSIYFLVAPHGGIRPAERRRSRLALTLAEREVISRGVTVHQSARSIAKLLGRSPSTVSRERAAMAAIIVTERHLRTRMRGRDLVVQNVVSWRSIRGFGGSLRSKALSLIVLPLMKCSRRIRAIVSTTSVLRHLLCYEAGSATDQPVGDQFWALTHF